MSTGRTYGIEVLTKERLEEIIGNDGYLGPVEEKDGKYYITTLKPGYSIDDVHIYSPEDYEKYYEVTGILSKSTPPEVVSKIIRSNSNNSAHIYDDNTMLEYVQEVERYMGEEVGYTHVNQDGTVDIYDIEGNCIVEGTRITENTDSSLSTKYDLSDVEDAVVSADQIDLDEQLNQHNKFLIEGYLKEVSGSSDTELVLNEQGYYVAYVNGKKIVFKKDSTIGDAIYEIGKEFQNDKSLKGYNKSGITYKLRQTADPQRIYIDVPSFESVKGVYSDAQGSVSAAKSSYNPGVLSGKLAEEFNSLVDANQSVTDELSKSMELMTMMSTNIDYSLQAYENIDHSLGIIINSIINEIFAINNFQGQETEEFRGMSLDERKEYLDNMITELKDNIDSLKADFEEKYPNDAVWFDKHITTMIMGIGNAFGLVERGKDHYYTDGTVKDGQWGASISTFIKVTDLMQKTDLLDSLKLYSDGVGWEESGLYELYSENATGAKSLGIYDSEQTFISRYIAFQDSSELRGVYGVGNFHPSWSYNDDEIKRVRNHIKNQLTYFDSLSLDVKNPETLENETLNRVDVLKYYVSDIQSDEELISTLETEKANYEQYREIMPYEADMQGDLYLEYLTQDWNKIDIETVCPELVGKARYMSQQEIALYMMYKGVSITDKVNPEVITGIAQGDKAEKYLYSIRDLLRRRQGLEEATLRVNQWKEEGEILGFLDNGKVALSDGVESFWQNVCRAVTATGEKSAEDYRDMYTLALLSNDPLVGDLSEASNLFGLDEMSGAVKKIYRKNYTVLKSVGSMVIPTMASFIPVIGPTAGQVLFGVNSFGSSVQSAMEYQLATSGETDAAKAYLYGGVSALSQVALNKFCGIVGLNGSTTPPKDASEFVLMMAKQSGRTVLGMCVDKVNRSLILGQPIDLSNFPEESVETIVNGLITAAILNGTTKLAIKLADGLVYNFSDRYNSYAEMMEDLKSDTFGTRLMNDLKQKFYGSKLGQKLMIFKAVGNERQMMKYDGTIVGKWLKEGNGDVDNVLMDFTDMTDNIISSQYTKLLQPGQRLVFDGKDYYIYNPSTESALNIPKGWLSTHESGAFDYSYLSTLGNYDSENESLGDISLLNQNETELDVVSDDNPYGEFGLPRVSSWQKYRKDNPLSREEASAYVDLYFTGTEVLGVTENGHIIIKTPTGEELEVTRDVLFSENLYQEMANLKYQKDHPNAENFKSLEEDWLLDQIEGMDKIVTPDGLSRTREEVVDDQVNQLATKFGVSPEEVRMALSKKLKDLYDSSDVGQRVSYDVLRLILRDGEIKNQLQTGTSDGMENPAYRKMFEDYFMGLVPLGDEHHPTYSHLFPNFEDDPDGFEMYMKFGPGTWYGKGKSSSTEVVLIMDKDVTTKATTLTMADSLDYGRRYDIGPYDNEEFFIQGATPASNPSYTGTDMDYFKQFSSLDEFSNASLVDITTYTDAVHDTYIETQIYGQSFHGLNSIKRVVLSSNPGQDVLDKLDSLSIDYTILNE